MPDLRGRIPRTASARSLSGHVGPETGESVGRRATIYRVRYQNHFWTIVQRLVEG